MNPAMRHGRENRTRWTRNRRLPVLLALFALLVQALLPAAAAAAQAGRGEQIQICTDQGMQTITVDAEGQPAKGFAGMPCQDCLAVSVVAVAPPQVDVQPVAYVVAPVTHEIATAAPQPRARAPPRPPGQGPPHLNV